MRFSVKQGFCLLAGLFFCTALAGEPVPIEDRDAFEKQYIECLMSGLKDDCLVSVFSGRIDKSVKNSEEAIRQSNTYYRDILQISPGAVYKIHPLDKIVRAGMFDSRTYLIEYDSDGLLLFCIIFIKRKENWYVGAYNMFSEDKEIFDALNLPFSPVK